ncbi:TPR [Mytilus coruscus]|uniref:TPR n=1 Tax=Mytilus coruscus TaxID=42192 RepID=A0A6J8AF62_MYTCO|nr:TPR [Mytilus coruscus]
MGEKRCKLEKILRKNLPPYSKKAEFDNNILRQQLNDLKQRLDTSTTTIVNLESKIREHNKSDTDIPQLLRQVRQAAEEDMRKHQAETERKHNDSISTLRVKMETQVSSLSQEKISLGDLIAQERLMAAAQLREMEKRLQDMQNAVFAKLQELNVSKESYIPLKAEIEAMKILLSEEEKRLRTPVNRNQVSTPYGKRKY